MDKNKINKNLSKSNVHHVLAHSYSMYFFLFLAGVVLDIIFKIKIFDSSIAVPVGFVFLVLATIIILWAQKAGREFDKVQDVKTEHFCRGPYCYTRIPTQWGLFLLILGFGIITNSFFVILFTVISFFFSKVIFMSKHDRILLGKYGSAYAEYKKMFRF